MSPGTDTVSEINGWAAVSKFYSELGEEGTSSFRLSLSATTSVGDLSWTQTAEHKHPPTQQEEVNVMRTGAILGLGFEFLKYGYKHISWKAHKNIAIKTVSIPICIWSLPSNDDDASCSKWNVIMTNISNVLKHKHLSNHSSWSWCAGRYLDQRCRQGLFIWWVFMP